jgi:hypothetical protein
MELPKLVFDAIQEYIRINEIKMKVNWGGRYRVPGYTSRELLEFEELNGVKIPKDLRIHLLVTKTIYCGKEHYVNLYEDDPFSFDNDNNFLPCSNHIVTLPNGSKKCLDEYLYDNACNVRCGKIARMTEIVLMEHGCGEYDAVNLETGRVECRDFYYDRCSWYYREYDSFTEWQRHKLGEASWASRG